MRRNASPVPRCLTRETVGHARSFAIALTFLAGPLIAQSAGFVAIPTFGASIFDAAGNLYTIGSGPVTPGAAQTQNGGGTCLLSNGFFGYVSPCPDAYVGKVDVTGKLVFGTYLGGTTYDQATAIAVDAAGNVYLTGTTGGSFPTTANAAIPVSATASGFAAKLSADGSTVLYSTYLPTTAARPTAIAVDPQGNAYIAGTTNPGHAFVMKLSADGSTFAYNVPMAGSKAETPGAIAADSSGNVIVAGQTQSPDFPVTPGVVQSHLAGTQNSFVAKLSAGGTILFSTYLGGNGADSAAVLRLDSVGNVYLAGQTTSTNFPTTAGSFQPKPVVPLWNNSPSNGFVARLTADGSALAWSTYVMSSDQPLQAGVTQLAITAAGEIYAAGLTGAGFPVTPSAPQACFQGNDANAYVIRLSANGALLDATYAGQDVVQALGLSVTTGGSLLLAWSYGPTTVLPIGFGAAGSTATPCLSPTILNSATMAVSDTLTFGVAAGEFITLTGFGLGPDIGVANQPAVKALAGVQVLFDGQPVPLLYVQSRQINVQAPVELTGKAQTTITVLYNQNTIGSIDANVLPFGVPGIFRLQPGVSTQGAIMNQDWSTNGPSNPAARGSIVTMFGTGLGTLDPPCATGGLNPYAAVNLAAGLGVFITWNNQEQSIPQYAGSAPTLACGVEQINVTVPNYPQPGNYVFFPTSTKNRGDGSLNANEGIIGSTIYVK